MKLYHELAEYYFSIEEGGRNINNDVLLIKSLLKDNIKPSLLDLGCGTGEHLFHLNKSDVRCLGMDKSLDMLKIANLRFPDAAEFIWGDMSSFDYNQEFDIIISLFGSFNYMIDDNDVNRVLINTNRALKSKGMGLFEIWNSKPLIKIQHRPISHVSTTYINGITIERQRGFRLLKDQESKTLVMVEYKYIFSTDKVILDQHVMRAFTKEEIEAFITGNGFRILSFYANSLKDAFKDTSNKFIVHFEKI